MNLKDFIRQSLLDISDGLSEANNSYRDSHKSEKAVFVLKPGGDEKEGKGIHFDIAVTTTSETGISGKGGINIKVIEMGTSGQNKEAKEYASRINFTVTINQYLT